MRRLLARFAVPAAFAVLLSGCGNGGGALPFAGPPNNAGGTGGTLQSGGTGSALLRFVQGSPDAASVDVCIDAAPLGGSSSTAIPYKGFTPPLAIVSGIPHTIAVYTVPSTGAGTECATAPGPYFGVAALATTSFTPAANVRDYVVLGGRAGSTLGLYFFPAALTFVNPPTSPEAQVFDASPTFGKAGLGYVVAGGAAANLAASLNAPKRSTPTAVVTTAGSFGAAPLSATPASFFVGAPVVSGTVVPLTIEPAAAPITGSTYVADVFSVDSATGAGVDVVSIAEPTTGYGF